MKNHPKQCRCANCEGNGFEAFDRKVRENIRRTGFHITWVGGTPQYPPFAYTAGLETTFCHPELIIFGIGCETSGQLLTSAVELIRRGVQFQTGDVYPGIAENYKMAFRPVPEGISRNELPVSYRAQPGISPRFLQMVWPDPRGRYPWDKDFDKTYLGMQPMLGLLV